MRAEFNQACHSTLNECMSIADTRGAQYDDTWALENQQSPFLDMVLREIAPQEIRGELSRQEKRLIHAASLCDVKLSRFLGGYRGDHIIDLVNYAAALRTWLDEYRHREPGCVS